MLTAFGKLVLWALSVAGDDERFLAEIDRMKGAIDDALEAPDAHDALVALLRYLSLTHERLGAKRIGNLLKTTAERRQEKVIMDVLDELRQEGREEGGGTHRRAQGRAQGRARGAPAEAAHRPVRARARRGEGAGPGREAGDAGPMGPPRADGPLAPGRARWGGERREEGGAGTQGHAGRARVESGEAEPCGATDGLPGRRPPPQDELGVDDGVGVGGVDAAELTPDVLAQTRYIREEPCLEVPFRDGDEDGSVHAVPEPDRDSSSRSRSPTSRGSFPSASFSTTNLSGRG